MTGTGTGTVHKMDQAPPPPHYHLFNLRAQELDTDII